MRKFLKPQLLTVCILFFCLHLVNAQQIRTPDTGNTSLNIPDSIKKLPARVGNIEKKIDTLQKKIATPKEACAVGCKGIAGSGEWILVLMPIVLFLLIGGILIYLILKGKFDLSEALSTNTTDTTIQEQQKSTERGLEPLNRTSNTKTKSVGSTSRLIAFLTGVTAIIIAICLLSYYAYFTIAECSGTPKFEDMWKILMGLGIGVVPYGVNVWRGNTKEKLPDVEPSNNQ